MRNRVVRIIVLALLVIAVLGSTCAAASRRPSVGLIPFHGAKSTFTQAVPRLIYWQLGFVPGVDLTGPSNMHYCVHLDRLSEPASLSDSVSYSRLAAAAGVDYLVVGEVEKQDRASITFRVVLFSASDSSFRREQVCRCSLSDLVDQAAQTAKWIALAAGVNSTNSAHYDKNRVGLDALRLMDQCIGLDIDDEADGANLVRAHRLADEAAKKCKGSPWISEWVLGYDTDYVRGIEAYSKLLVRCPGNSIILRHLIFSYCYYGGSTGMAKRHALQWLKIDPAAPVAQIAASGRCTSTVSGGWQTDLSLADIYGATHDVPQMEKRILALESRCPNSAYIRYSAWRLFGWARQYASSQAAIAQAVRLNRGACSLQMRLAKGYEYVGNSEAALATVKKIIKRWPKRSDSHVLAARIYRQQEEYGKAVREYRAAEKLDPDANVDHKFMVRQEIRSGHLIGALQQMAATDPNARRGAIILTVVLICIYLLVMLAVVAVVRFAFNSRARSKG